MPTSHTSATEVITLNANVETAKLTATAVSVSASYITANDIIIVLTVLLLSAQLVVALPKAWQVLRAVVRRKNIDVEIK